MNKRFLTVAGLGIALALAGCENFDPMDKLQDLDIMATSKPVLKGERKPVFNSGVPGVPQGVPPDLVKGYQPPPEPAPAPVAEVKVKPKPKKVAVRRPPPQAMQAQAPTRSAPAARTTATTTTTSEQGATQQMPGSAPAWPSNAPPAPTAWPGPQK